MCNVDGSFKRVGYVVKDARNAVYDSFIRNDITVVKFKSVTGTVLTQGFAAVNITTKGVWPPNVEVEKYTLSTVVA